LGGIALGFDGGGRFFNTERLRNGRGLIDAEMQYVLRYN
jgi:hypothetical protein